MSTDPAKDNRLEEMIAIAIREKLGILILALHPKNAFGRKETVNIWLRRGSPKLDLAGLMALQLWHNWRSEIRIITVVDDAGEVNKAESTLVKIADRARMPSETAISVLVGSFKEGLVKAPKAAI